MPVPLVSPDPESLERAFQDAIAAHGRGEFAIASALYDGLLAHLPDHPILLLRRGVAARQSGDSAEAVAYLTRATEVVPQDGEACSNLANALGDIGDSVGARTAHLRAAMLAPEHPGVLINTAGFLVREGDVEPAIALLSRALEREPNHALGWGLAGDAAKRLGRFDEAETAMRLAVTLDPNDTDRRYNLGNLLIMTGRFGAARAELSAVLDRRPNDPRVLTNLGLAMRGDPAAGGLHARALALDPAFLPARMNQAVHLLLSGDYAAGWPAYEARHQVMEALDRGLTEPCWDGRPLTADAPLLVWAEQGLGDVVMMLRYLPAVTERATRVIVEMHPGMGPLAGGFPSGVVGIERGQPLPPFAVQLPMTSLGRVLAATPDQPPVTVPYLAAPEAARQAWRQRLPDAPDGPARVGLVWAGSQGHANDYLRTRRLADLAPLFRHPRVRFLALQVGAGRDDLATAPGPAPLEDLGPALTDFGETAAALERLDLLISVDTSVLNLAGALGRPAWGILPPNPDWRWLRAGERTPWYPSIRLFRRDVDAAGDAEPVGDLIGRIDRAFVDWLRDRNRPSGH